MHSPPLQPRNSWRCYVGGSLRSKRELQIGIITRCLREVDQWQWVMAAGQMIPACLSLYRHLAATLATPFATCIHRLVRAFLGRRRHLATAGATRIQRLSRSFLGRRRRLAAAGLRRGTASRCLQRATRTFLSRRHSQRPPGPAATPKRSRRQRRSQRSRGRLKAAGGPLSTRAEEAAGGGPSHGKVSGLGQLSETQNCWSTVMVPRPFKDCGACWQPLPSRSYSKKQWRARGQRRCKACITGGRPIAAHALAPPPPSGRPREVTRHFSTTYAAGYDEKPDSDHHVWRGDWAALCETTPNRVELSRSPEGGGTGFRLNVAVSRPTPSRPAPLPLPATPPPARRLRTHTRAYARTHTRAYAVASDSHAHAHTHA